MKMKGHMLKHSILIYDIQIDFLDLKTLIVNQTVENAVTVAVFRCFFWGMYIF